MATKTILSCNIYNSIVTYNIIVIPLHSFSSPPCHWSSRPWTPPPRSPPRTWPPPCYRWGGSTWQDRVSDPGPTWQCRSDHWQNCARLCLVEGCSSNRLNIKARFRINPTSDNANLHKPPLWSKSSCPDHPGDH